MITYKSSIICVYIRQLRKQCKNNIAQKCKLYDNHIIVSQNKHMDVNSLCNQNNML